MTSEIGMLIASIQSSACARFPPGSWRREPRAFVGVILVLVAMAASALLSWSLLLVFLAYAGLMAAYNLGVKEIAILDVFAIAAGFVLRAVGGAIAVDVSISPWLLVCTMLLALLIGFGKRRHELVALENARGHRRNLNVYNRPMLDQSRGGNRRRHAHRVRGLHVRQRVRAVSPSHDVDDPHRRLRSVPVLLSALSRRPRGSARDDAPNGPPAPRLGGGMGRRERIPVLFRGLRRIPGVDYRDGTTDDDRPAPDGR